MLWTVFVTSPPTGIRQFVSLCRSSWARCCRKPRTTLTGRSLDLCSLCRRCSGYVSRCMMFAGVQRDHLQRCPEGAWSLHKVTRVGIHFIAIPQYFCHPRMWLGSVFGRVCLCVSLVCDALTFESICWTALQYLGQVHILRSLGQGHRSNKHVCVSSSRVVCLLLKGGVFFKFNIEICVFWQAADHLFSPYNIIVRTIRGVWFVGKDYLKFSRYFMQIPRLSLKSGCLNPTHFEPHS